MGKFEFHVAAVYLEFLDAELTVWWVLQSLQFYHVSHRIHTPHLQTQRQTHYYELLP